MFIFSSPLFSKRARRMMVLNPMVCHSDDASNAALSLMDDEAAEDILSGSGGGGSPPPAPRAEAAPVEVAEPSAEELDALKRNVAGPANAASGQMSDEDPDAEKPAEDQAAAPVDGEPPAGEGAQPEQAKPVVIAPEVMQVIERVVSPLVERATKTDQLLEQLVQSRSTERQHAQAQAIRARIEASRPKPPPPEAPEGDHLRYEAQLTRWENSQSVQQLGGLLKTFIQRQTALNETQERQRAEQAQQAEAIQIRAQYDANLKAVSSSPKYAHITGNPFFMEQFERAYKDACFAANTVVDPTQLIEKFAANIPRGNAPANAKTQQVDAQARLQAERAKVRQAGAPKPFVGTGKQSAPAPGAKPNSREAAKEKVNGLVRKYERLGAIRPGLLN